MAGRCDVVLVNPGDRREAYQQLASRLAAVEPPLWVGMLATFLRGRGFSVAVVDADAEGLSPDASAERIAACDPVLAAVIVFGANPSASTMKMTAAGEVCAALRARAPRVKSALGGVHVSALPERTLREEQVDFVIRGEGPYTLEGLLGAMREGGEDFTRVPGLWYRRGEEVVGNPPAPLVSDLDAELPAAAWDLLPMRRYRAHNWHCFDDLRRRSPYAAVYTSLGCPFSCSFCCVNALFGGAGIRYRSPGGVVGEIDLLARRYGVRNIKVADELFVLEPARVEAICDGLIRLGHDLNLWAYARVDTVTASLLEKMKRAGFNWLAYGFESASPKVRDGVNKRFADETAERAIEMTRRAGIHIIANFIFGLPDDDRRSMDETLAMAKRHNFEFVNFYCAMAYPGSPLHRQAVAQGWPLPADWRGYCQLGPETLPLPTRHLSAAEVLRFRDHAFVDYFSDDRYQRTIAEKFGPHVAEHVREMLRVRLIRRHAAAD